MSLERVSAAETSPDGLILVDIHILRHGGVGTFVYYCLNVGRER
jgi:hypothetical protein